MAAAALSAWLLAMPLVLPWLLPGALEHDAARLLQVGLLALCALACAGPLASARLDTKATLPALLALGGAGWAVAAAPEAAWALRELAVFGGLAALAWLVARHVPPAVLHGAVVGGAALYAAVVLLLGALIYAAGTGVTREEIFLGYANRRFFNHVQTVAIPLCVLVGAIGGTRLLRGLAWLAVTLQTSLLILCAGRATMLALAVGAAVVVPLTWRHARLIWRPAAAALLGGVAVYLLVFEALPMLATQPPAPNADLQLQRLGDGQARGGLWRQALAAAAAHPWLGVGPMHLAHAPAFNGTAAHPHNLYLQLAAEWGLPMLLLLFWLAWPRLRQAWQGARHASTPEPAGLLLVLVAIAVDACFSGNLVMPVSQVWAAVAVGWLWRAGAAPQVHDAAPPPASGGPGLGERALRMGLFALVVLLPLWLAVVVGMEWDGREGEHAAALREFAAPRMHPRFWTHGWF